MSILEVPTAVLSYGLTGDAVYLYLQLLSLVVDDEGFTQAVTQQELAQRVQLAHRNSVAAPLRILRAAGLVNWRAGAEGRGPRSYWVNMKPPVRQQPPLNAPNGVHYGDSFNAPSGVHLAAVNAPSGVHYANAPAGVHYAAGQQKPSKTALSGDGVAAVNAPSGVHYNSSQSRETFTGAGGVNTNSLDLTGVEEPVIATTGKDDITGSRRVVLVNTGTGGTGVNTHARTREAEAPPKKLLAKEKAKIRFHLGDLTPEAQRALAAWRQMQGMEKVPVLNRLLAEDLENTVATIHESVLEEASKWCALNQVPELIKWLRVARRIVREGGVDEQGRYAPEKNAARGHDGAGDGARGATRRPDRTPPKGSDRRRLVGAAESDIALAASKYIGVGRRG